MGFDDEVIEDGELERLLEDRELLIEAHTTYREKTKAAQDRVKGLGKHVSFRCGRFVISVKPKESQHVECDQGSRVEVAFTVAEKE